MEGVLRKFTALGDPEIYDDDLEPIVDEDPVTSVSPAIISPDRSFRDALRMIFGSQQYQVLVIFLVLLDAAFVLGELLIDVSSTGSEVLHYLSLSVLSLFMVELLIKLYVFRLEFLHHGLELLDAAVVLISFVLDIVYSLQHSAFDATGLLVLLRLWRVVRIANGIVISVKGRARNKISVLRNEKEALMEQLTVREAEQQKQEVKIHKMESLLREHGIDLPPS
uniref:voltage-gated hydrogen channel 1 n=1 Tax=Myxine glutinosa TaxID=7769 RepID=UPI00358F29B3